MQGFECTRHPGSLAPRALQVPWPPKNHCFEEVGIYQCSSRGVPEAQGRQEGIAVRIIPVLLAWMLTLASRDGAYVQFIRPRGPLEANLRAQLKA